MKAKGNIDMHESSTADVIVPPFQEELDNENGVDEVEVDDECPELVDTDQEFEDIIDVEPDDEEEEVEYGTSTDDDEEQVNDILDLLADDFD